MATYVNAGEEREERQMASSASIAYSVSRYVTPANDETIWHLDIDLEHRHFARDGEHGARFGANGHEHNHFPETNNGNADGGEH